ncbi:MAG: MarR family winged helix-turn-helix transcriptional regulator [Hyphomicrobiales bacterium]
MSTRDEVPFSTTLHVRDHCLCLHVQRAARALARRFDEALREVGLNNGQFSMMMSLNRPEPPTMQQVAGLLAMDRTTLTAKLKPLQREGLVQIAPDARDKRSRRLSLTDKGRRVLASAVPIWQREHGMLDGELGDARGKRMRADLFAVSFPAAAAEKAGQA